MDNNKLQPCFSYCFGYFYISQLKLPFINPTKQRKKKNTIFIFSTNTHNQKYNQYVANHTYAILSGSYFTLFWNLANLTKSPKSGQKDWKTDKKRSKCRQIGPKCGILGQIGAKSGQFEPNVGLFELKIKDQPWITLCLTSYFHLKMWANKVLIHHFKAYNQPFKVISCFLVEFIQLIFIFSLKM